MNINEMTAGREMDALIAEKVMGWEIERNKIFVGGIGLRISKGTTTAITEFNPSTDIAVAWKVVKHMKKQGWSFRFSNNAYADGQNAAAFYRAFRGLGRDILSGLYVYKDEAWAVGGECSAICRAALKAMGVSTNY